ncbi:MAG: type II toxin-antitoxin system Phd/YefM family antitoxin [Candidatus Binatia bacterium]
MKRATAKELRRNTAALLDEVKRGGRVLITRRNRVVAVLAPPREEAPAEFEPVGFGMWADHEELGDVTEWVRGVREPRQAP